jgi:hypothetical protein
LLWLSFDYLVLLHRRLVPPLRCFCSSCQVAAIRQPGKHHGIYQVMARLTTARDWDNFLDNDQKKSV